MSALEHPDIAGIARESGVGQVLDIEPIKHGLTNRSWLVHASNGTIVVRASNALEEQLQIDRRSEAVVMEEVARAGIGPRVLLSDPARGLLVTQFHGRTWEAEDAHCDDNIERLGHILGRLHVVPIPFGVRAVELESTVHGYLRTLDERGVRGGLTGQALRDCADQIAAKLRNGAATCLCHNDVHHLNVVEGAELRLIDWEYAGMGEPLFDLASVCVYHRYRKPQREHLLSAYARGGDALTWQRLELACWLFDYIRDLWMAVRTIEPKAAH